MDDYIKSMIKDFFDEAFEMLERLEQNILILEKDHHNKDAVQEIFRAIHTLKGSAGAVELNDTVKYAHKFEDLLDLIRNDKIDIDGDTIDVLLKGIDIVKGLINAASDEKVYPGNLNKELKSIEEFRKSRLVIATNSRKNNNAVSTKENASKYHGIEITADTMSAIRDSLENSINTYLVYVKFNTKHPMRTVGGIQVLLMLKSIGELVLTNPSMKELESEEFYEDVLYILISELDKNKIASEVKIPDVTKSIKVELFDIIEYEQYFNKIAKELEKKDKPNNISKPIDAEENIKQDKQSSFLRVESDRVDEMMNQVGELVINKSSYQQYENEFSNYEKLLEESINDIKKYYKDSVVKILRRFEDSMSKKEFKETRNEYLESFNTKIKYMTDMGTEFKQSLDKFRDSYLILTRVTNDLQSTVMKIRMVPIAQTFNRFRRLVRDLSRELEKDVVLEVLGEDTELDKSVIEVLVDPLVHLIRNALGHGIESPDEREKRGKPRTGTIRLSASHEGNLIIIKVSDDGYGMNPNVIFESAVKKGVVDKDAKLTDIEKIDLIYLTDFTTTTKVSSLSGRGVGMDVVKKSLEKINGRITIETVVGEGTSFSLKIPLTLAIIQALIVESEKEYYSIPINSIVETIKIDKDEIKMLENVFVINVRDELVNVLSIKNLFNLPSQYEDIESYYAVILMVEDKKIALLVNNLIGEQDIVIKALKDKITKSQGIAGATILGDGRVSFILDIQTIIDLGNKRILEHISASHHDKASIDKINLKSFIESIKENNLESKVENEEDNTKL